MLHNIDLKIIQNFTGTIDELSNYLSDKYVTEKSKFADGTWEFETKPNIEKVNFSQYEKKLNNKNLVIFWKLFTYIVIHKKNLQNKAQVVLVSTSKSLFEYLNILEFPSNSVIFTSKNTQEYIDILQLKNQSHLYKTHQLQMLKYWFEINQYLPTHFRLPYNPLININTNGTFKDTNKNFKRGRHKQEDEDWSPLTIPQAMILTQAAILWVEEYSNDILDVFNEWKDYAGKYPRHKEFIAFGTKHIDRIGAGNTKNKKLANIVYNHFPVKPDAEHPFYYIWKLGNEFEKNRLSGKKLKSSIKQKDIMTSLRSLYGACIVLILFSTGMRKSELFSLQRGCIDVDTNPDIPLIESEVTKTNTGITKLPISQIGVEAVNILERLGKILTEEENGPLIIAVEKNKKDAYPNKIANYTSHISKMLTVFCDTINYGNPPNPHSFRHTLAACVWERTDQAPVLLKMLYNHSSLSMTLYYLRSNPIIQYAQKELFTKKYLPLVRNVIHDSLDDNLAGKASPRVKSLTKYIQNDLQFQGKTEEELETAMEDLFMTLIEQDQIRLFLTPFCICMRPNTSATKSPCMYVEDHGDSVFSKLPRTDRCVGSNCHDSLFTQYHQRSIHECMMFYNESVNYLPDDLKSNIYYAKVIEHESAKYKKIEKQLSKKRMDNNA